MVVSEHRRKHSWQEAHAHDTAHEPIERRSCNCKNSRCLKLYCECFPAHDHQLLTNRGFLLLADVLALLAGAPPGDWRGLAFASYDPRSQHIVYRTPRRLVVNAPGAPVVEFSAPAAQLSVVATRRHALFVAPSADVAFRKLACADVVARFDSCRFLALAANGVAVDGDAWRRAPFVTRLALRSRAELDAFLQLYGLWLGGDGSRAPDGALRFGAAAASASASAALLRPLFKRAGLCAATGDCTATTVRKRSWIALLDAPAPAPLVDGVVGFLDASALRCIVQGLCAATADGSICVRGAALRDELAPLLLHAGLTATFEPAPDGRWRMAVDSAESVDASMPRVQLSGGAGVREYACGERTWCVDLDDGFVIVRRVVLETHKSGAAVVARASRATIQGNCFAAGVYCNESCACVCCSNAQINERVVAKAIEETTERNPTAFKTEEKMAKGCNCKKSHCLKKYCECFQAGSPCTSTCRCIDCKNDLRESVVRPPPPASRRLSAIDPRVALADALPLSAAAYDDDQVYLSASQIAAHTVARDWASEAALVDIAASLLKRAQRAVAEPTATSFAVASTSSSSTTRAAAPPSDALESVATAIRESGEVNVRGVSESDDKYARQERALLVGVREILDKAVADLARNQV